MVSIPSKSERDQLGIDTVERGLVFAVLNLQIATAGTADESLISFNHSVSNSPRITSQVKIKYNRTPSLRSAGDYLANILAFSDGDPGEFITSDPSTIQGEMIPDDPFFFTSLEKYFVWLSYVLSASIYPETEYCKVSPVKESNTDYLKINLSLLFNYRRFTVTGNYVESVNKLTSSYVDSIEEIAGNGVLIPSAQYWKDPLVSLTALADFPYSGLSDGTTLIVLNEGLYVFYNSGGSIVPNGKNFIRPTGGTTQLWVKDASVNWADLLNRPTFSTVATSGSYADLLNKPTIPTAIAQLNNDANFITAAQAPVQSVNGQIGDVTVEPGGTVAWSDILNRPTFATVATSGSYADLLNKPTIPTNNNQLTNGANFITANQAPVQSVNGQTGDVTIGTGGAVAWVDILNKPSLVNTVNGQSGDVTVTGGSGGGSSNNILYEDLANSDTLPSQLTVISGTATYDSNSKMRILGNSGLYCSINNISNVIGGLSVRAEFRSPTSNNNSIDVYLKRSSDDGVVFYFSMAGNISVLDSSGARTIGTGFYGQNQYYLINLILTPSCYKLRLENMSMLSNDVMTASGTFNVNPGSNNISFYLDLPGTMGISSFRIRKGLTGN